MKLDVLCWQLSPPAPSPIIEGFYPWHAMVLIPWPCPDPYYGKIEGQTIIARGMSEAEAVANLQELIRRYLKPFGPNAKFIQIEVELLVAPTSA